MNEPLLDVLGFLGGTVAVLVDRRRAVLLAAVAVALTLSPTAATFGGGPAALILCGAALGAGLFGGLARSAGEWIRGGSGFDPLVPVFSPRHQLFGPRSLRLVAAAVSIPAASWISYNIPIGTAAPVRGVLFPITFIWICGAIRLILARTIEDIAVGVAVVALASSCAWIVRGGDDPLNGAIAAAALVPAAAIVADWLSGRRAARARREVPT